MQILYFRHTVKHRGKSFEIKRQVHVLYIEGLGFRSNGRILNCSHVAVFNWIKAFGEKLTQIRSESELEIEEIDEMHTYIYKKILLDLDFC